MAALSSTSSLRGVTPVSAVSLPWSRSVAHTVAPSRAKACAVAAPIPCPAAVTTHTLPFSLIFPPLPDQAFFLVELLRAGMQRNAEADGSRLEADDAALGVPGVQQLARVGVPQRGRDLVDQIFRLLARCHPQGVDADGLHARDILIGIVRNLVGAEEVVLLDQLVGLWPGDRHELEPDGRRRIAHHALSPTTYADNA